MIAHRSTKYPKRSTSGNGARVSYRTMFPKISAQRSLLEQVSDTCRVFVWHDAKQIRDMMGGLFEPRTTTGTEHLACQDSGLFQIFKLIVSANENCNYGSVKRG